MAARDSRSGRARASFKLWAASAMAARASARWWGIEGFHFDGSDGAVNSYNPVQFRSRGGVAAEHVRLCNCAMTDLVERDGEVVGVLAEREGQPVRIRAARGVVLAAGGLGRGGFNFDAKIRRESTDLEDLFIGHIGGMDSFARGLVIADRILNDPRYAVPRNARHVVHNGKTLTGQPVKNAGFSHVGATDNGYLWK